VGTIVKWNVVDTTGVVPGQGGANVTWNFSNITVKPDQHQNNWVDPKSTPHAASFAEATHCEQSDTVYSYFVLEKGRWTRLGEESQAFQSGRWADPLDVAKVPWSYNESYSDVARHSFTTNGVPVKRGGTISGKYDGYGTLILPKGTFSNVLRISYTQVIIDTITIDAGPFTIVTIVKSTITSSSWFEPNNSEFLFNITDVVAQTTMSGPAPSDQTIYAKTVYVSTKAGGTVTVLDPPTLLLPLDEADVESDSIRLSNSTVDGAKSYRVQVSALADFSTLVIDTTSANTFVNLSNLVKFKLYYWRVAGVSGPIQSKLHPNVQAEPNWSVVRSFRVVPNAPRLTSPASNATVPKGNVTFVWTSDADDDELEYSTDSTFNTNATTVSTKTKSSSALLETSGLYYWHVRSVRTPDFVGSWSKRETFVVSDNVSVSESDRDTQISLSPNPTTEFVNILMDAAQFASIVVFDANGALVATKNVKGLSSTKLDVSAFANGAYTLSLLTPTGKVVSKRFVVNR